MKTVWPSRLALRGGPRPRTLAVTAWVAMALSAVAAATYILHLAPAVAWLEPALLLAGLVIWVVVAGRASLLAILAPGAEQPEVPFELDRRPTLLVDRSTLGIVGANLAACHKYGYDPDTFATLGILDLQRPGERASAESRWSAARERRAGGRWAETHLAKDGTELPVKLRLTRGRRSTDTIRLTVATAGARGDRPPAEDAEMEPLYQQIVETAHEGVLTVDHEMVISDANQSTADMLGFPIEELVGRPVAEFYAPEQAGADGGEMQMRSGIPVEQRSMDLQNKDGLTIPVLVNQSQILDSAGRHLGQLDMISDLTERHGLQDKLDFQALHDPLTGLANRVLLTESLHLALGRATNRTGRVAVVFVDIDGFRNVNTAHGNRGGDALLLEVARRLSATVREPDIVARFGGNEFVVIAEHSGHSQASVRRFADRLRQGLAGPCPFGDAEVAFTVSMGVAIGRRGDRPGRLLRSADIALVKAKAAGGDRTEFFSPALATASRERLAIASDLRHAVERQEFSLRFQPIVSMADATIVGAEALLRWEHPGRGTIGPGEFVAVAEETGAIGPIGAWVIQEACRQFARWQLLQPDLALSLNVSAIQIASGNLHRVVQQAVEAAGMDPSHLTLEITESVLMGDVEQSRSVLAALRATGVRIAVDDFGTGYSSLSYLNTFPLDALKIDQSFVAGLPSNACDSALIGAIVAIAEALGLNVVAEGVETQAQATRLLDLGCQRAQGYLFHRPLTAEAFTAALTASMTSGSEPPSPALPQMGDAGPVR